MTTFLQKGGLLLSLLFSLLHAQQRGDILLAELVQAYSQAELQVVYQQNAVPEFIAPIEYPVELYKIIYYTPAVHGDSLTTASGLIAVPMGDCDFPMLSYSHGTTYYGNTISGRQLEWQVGAVMAANGYLTVMADYLGYGETPLSHPHPYMHAESEATATIDMLRAARTWCQAQSVRFNDQLFLMGYSQGGHVSMATFKAMEEDYGNEFAVTAAAPGAGPYDLSGATFDNFLEEKPTASFYLAFLMLSYQYVYGDLWSNPSEAFVAPYDGQLPQMYDREQMGSEINLPDTAIRMIQPSYVEAVLQDSLHPANVALRANDLYDWTPTAPLRMYHCSSDEVVPFSNATLAESQFQANGSPDVAIVNVGQSFGHEACAIPTFMFTKTWFDSFRAACTATSLSETDMMNSLRVVPNFRERELLIDGDAAALAKLRTIRLFDMHGRMTQQWQVQSAGESVYLPLSSPSAGIYAVELMGETQPIRRKVRLH